MQTTPISQPGNDRRKSTYRTVVDQIYEYPCKDPECSMAHPKQDLIRALRQDNRVPEWPDLRAEVTLLEMENSSLQEKLNAEQDVVDRLRQEKVNNRPWAASYMEECKKTTALHDEVCRLKLLLDMEAKPKKAKRRAK